MSDNTTVPWRVGRTYSVHVYAGDVPVGTFHTSTDAHAAVKAHNDALGSRRGWSDPAGKDDAERWVKALQATIARLDNDVATWVSRAVDAEATLERVNALHHTAPGGQWCRQCGSNWPCPTIRALEVPTEPASELELSPDAPSPLPTRCFCGGPLPCPHGQPRRAAGTGQEAGTARAGAEKTPNPVQDDHPPLNGPQNAGPS